LQLDSSLSILERGRLLRIGSKALQVQSAELRQRGAFNTRRLTRLLNRSADLATIVRFREAFLAVKPGAVLALVS
jgi:hypothetical protein